MLRKQRCTRPDGGSIVSIGKTELGVWKVVEDDKIHVLRNSICAIRLQLTRVTVVVVVIMMMMLVMGIGGKTGKQ